MNDPRPTDDPQPERDPGARQAGRSQHGRRSALPLVLAIAVALTGIVWMLQGLGILTAGGSFMIGDPTWTVIGTVFVVMGVGLGVRARRARED